MKTYGLVLIIFVAVAAMPACAATRAEFDQLVQQVQAKPGDTALRERVIRMAAELKPAPAVPEEARKNFVAGSAIAKAAKDVSGQKLAIKKFQTALKIAPWWGDAYYNLTTAQELAGQFDDAIASIKLYVLTNPGENEARDAQDRIYALEGKAELAKTERSNKSAAPTRTQAAASVSTPPAAPSLDGAAFVWRRDAGVNGMQESTIEIRGRVANVTYANSLWRQQGRWPLVFQCTLIDRHCDFGIIDSDESIGLVMRAELSLPTDGQTAIWKSTTNGGVTEERVHQALR